MTFADNLMALRRQKGLSQEQLGAEVGVSRQTVSKWELGATTPELDKLIALGELFDTSLDELVGREFKADPLPRREPEHHVHSVIHYDKAYEYKSSRTFRGLPLIHVHFSNLGLARAKGIIAIGNIATGGVAIGGIAVGGFAFGGLSLGLLSLGGVAAGLLALAGCALGLFVWGGVAIGYLAIGGAALGVYAAGGVATGFKFAMGNVANAPLVLNTWNLPSPLVPFLLERNIPRYLVWLLDFFAKFF